MNLLKGPVFFFCERVNELVDLFFDEEFWTNTHKIGLNLKLKVDLSEKKMMQFF